MPTAYDDLYAWVVTVFGSEPFTVGDFADAFPSPSPRKVVSDLKRLGYVEPVVRGQYRAVPPERRVRDAIGRATFSLALPHAAGLPYAFSDDTAIAVWTDGGYWSGFTRGLRPIHLRVRRKDVAQWLAYFRSGGRRAVVAGSRETLFGVVYVLHPVTVLRSVDRGDHPVIPARDALAFARARSYTYGPVLRRLRRLVSRERS